MEAQELREKTEQELLELLASLRKELQKLRVEHRLEGLTDTNVLRAKRRDIARIMTVLEEKEILKQIAEREEIN
ncbi:MAG: 50S ribosomal protein L29 [Patescibacteria group bacterium]